MAKIIYKYCNFVILESMQGGYIVYNQRKPFQQGHTHLSNYKACKDLIYYALKRQIPKNPTVYYLISLKRISIESHFINKIEQRIQFLL